MDLSSFLLGGFVVFTALGLLVGTLMLLRNSIAKVNQVATPDEAPANIVPRFFFSPPTPQPERPTAHAAAARVTAYLRREQVCVAQFVSEPSVDSLYDSVEGDLTLN